MVLYNQAPFSTTLLGGNDFEPFKTVWSLCTLKRVKRVGKGDKWGNKLNNGEC